MKGCVIPLQQANLKQSQIDTILRNTTDMMNTMAQDKETMMKLEDFVSFCKYIVISDKNGSNPRLVSTKKFAESIYKLFISAKKTISIHEASDILVTLHTAVVGTMATNPRTKEVFVNVQFAVSLTDDQVKFVLCHELYHLRQNILPTAVKYFSSICGDSGSADRFVHWYKDNAVNINIAADYEDNYILQRSGLVTKQFLKSFCFDEELGKLPLYDILGHVLTNKDKDDKKKSDDKAESDDLMSDADWRDEDNNKSNDSPSQSNNSKGKGDSDKPDNSGNNGEGEGDGDADKSGQEGKGDKGKGDSNDSNDSNGDDADGKGDSNDSGDSGDSGDADSNGDSNDTSDANGNDADGKGGSGDSGDSNGDDAGGKGGSNGVSGGDDDSGEPGDPNGVDDSASSAGPKGDVSRGPGHTEDGKEAGSNDADSERTRDRLKSLSDAAGWDSHSSIEPTEDINISDKDLRAAYNVGSMVFNKASLDQLTSALSRSLTSAKLFTKQFADRMGNRKFLWRKEVRPYTAVSDTPCALRLFILLDISGSQLGAINATTGLVAALMKTQMPGTLIAHLVCLADMAEIETLAEQELKDAKEMNKAASTALVLCTEGRDTMDNGERAKPVVEKLIKKYKNTGPFAALVIGDYQWYISTCKDVAAMCDAIALSNRHIGYSENSVILLNTEADNHYNDVKLSPATKRKYINLKK